MKNSGLLKWTLNRNKSIGSTNGKSWIHPPDSLTNGHIAYLVKFFGVTEAEHPKGIEVVKDSIRKLKLDEDIRRSEGGKTPKAELTISVEGVAIQDPKTKQILHQFPLHQISYCADDKEEKKFFSFIAKDGEIHRCFVFASEKLAEEITLTIGQAFDLAYKKFLDSSGRELELKREIIVLQNRVAELETENMELKGKLSLRSVDGNSNSSLSSSTSNVTPDLFSIPPPVPPRLADSANFANQIIAEFAVTANEIEKRAQTGRKCESIFVEDDLFGSEKPRGPPDGIEAPPRLSPPPKSKKTENGNSNGNGSISSDPFSSVSSSSSSDLFGMSNFTSSTNGNSSVMKDGGSNKDGFIAKPMFSNTNILLHAQQQQQRPNNTLDNAIFNLDKKIEDMKQSFSCAILKDDFPLEMLDPLRQSS